MANEQPCLDPNCDGGPWHYDPETNTALEPCPVNNPKYRTPAERAAAKAELKEKKSKKKPPPGSAWWNKD